MGALGRAVHPELEFRNFGIWGERTDEIAARFDTAVAGADVLIVQGGINDIAQGRAARACSGQPARHGRARARARPPRRRVRRAAVERRLAREGGADPRLNARIHALDVPVLPFHDTLEDPDAPGRMKPEWCNEDGDHPSVAGYRRLGELAFRLP